MKKTSKQALRAWTDPVYRATLSADELAKLERNPAGLLELELEQLEQVMGGLDFLGSASGCGTCITSACDPSRVIRDCR
ncbi:MAG TPA: mersacidin/lichenicidin family type 2 lantibiotic [Kofleriaceae bacterium]|jgi:mersacidin/lichenicidin family type 2 lantibiotic